MTGCSSTPALGGTVNSASSRAGLRAATAAAILLAALAFLTGTVFFALGPVLVSRGRAAEDAHQDRDRDDGDDDEDEQGYYRDAQNRSPSFHGKRLPGSARQPHVTRCGGNRPAGAGSLARLGAWSAELDLTALDLAGKVFEVLAHLALGVGEHVRRDLPHLAAGRVGVVHRHVYASAPRGGLLEANLAGGLHVAAHAVPADATARVHLGGRGVDLEKSAQGTLHLPVAGLLVDDTDFLDVAHDRGKVLEVRPVSEDVLQRSPHLCAFVDALSHGLTLRTRVCPTFPVQATHERLRLNRIPPLRPVNQGPHRPENGVVEHRQ